MSQPSKIQTALLKLKNPAKAKNLARFFKTAPGEYGAGDQFLGVTNPEIRQVLREFGKDAEDWEIIELVHSPWHEARLLGFLCIVQRYEKTKIETEKEKCVILYLKNKNHLNNWDLIDVTTPRILGDWFFNKDKSDLYTMASSKDLWENRISMLATMTFIKRGKFEDCIAISEILLSHSHDLIHKAVGWMLREMGKVDKKPLVSFLEKHSKVMPRTMLRYSIEKLPEKERKHWLTSSKHP